MSDEDRPAQEQKTHQVRLKPVLPDDVAEGSYSNLATIISGPAEFYLDFGRVVPGRAEFRIFSRVILSPAHAKQLAQALAENVRAYEKTHGPIPGLPPGPPRGEGKEGGGGFH